MKQEPPISELWHRGMMVNQKPTIVRYNGSDSRLVGYVETPWDCDNIINLHNQTVFRLWAAQKENK